MKDETRDLPLDLITEPLIVLRPVNKGVVEYLELLDSLQQRGFINSISVRPSPRAPGKFEIVDGLYRYTCAVELGLASIPCIIKHGLTDEDVLAMQVEANLLGVETTPIEYCHRLKRILKHKPDMTFAELARTVHKNPAWVKDRLGLLELSEALQQRVDRGEIPLTSAYMLAKIPRRLRREYVDHALTMPARDFQALAAGVIKQFTECVQQGRMDERYMPEFVPQIRLRALREIRQEYEAPEIAATMMVIEGCKTTLDGWNACLKWVLHQDTRSVEEQRHAALLRQRTNALESEPDNGELIPPT